jgi:hypothetical protein
LFGSVVDELRAVNLERECRTQFPETVTIITYLRSLGKGSGLICLDGLLRPPARACGALREKSNLLKRINVICPVQSPLQKYFCFSEVQIRLHDLPSRPGKRGVGHRHERWGGERWTRQCRRASVIAGRILSIREWPQCAQTNGIEAYGKIVWS